MWVLTCTATALIPTHSKQLEFASGYLRVRNAFSWSIADSKLGFTEVDGSSRLLNNLWSAHQALFDFISMTWVPTKVDNDWKHPKWLHSSTVISVDAQMPLASLFVSLAFGCAFLYPQKGRPGCMTSRRQPSNSQPAKLLHSTLHFWTINLKLFTTNAFPLRRRRLPSNEALKGALARQAHSDVVSRRFFYLY